MSDYIRREDAINHLEELTNLRLPIIEAIINGIPAADVVDQPRWIPVTERLPERRVEVLVCNGICIPYVVVAFYDGLWYSTWDGETVIDVVTHWMPLPEPPKEVEE